MEGKGRKAENVPAGLSPYRIGAGSAKNPFSMANDHWLMVIVHPPFF